MTSGDPDVTFGYDAVRNASQGILELEKVTLVTARGVTLEDSLVAPVSDSTLVGVRRGWDGGRLSGPGAHGTELPATLGPGQTANLILHLKVSVPGDLEAIEVTYVSGDELLRVRNSTSLQVRPTCS